MKLRARPPTKWRRCTYSITENHKRPRGTAPALRVFGQVHRQWRGLQLPGGNCESYRKLLADIRLVHFWPLGIKNLPERDKLLVQEQI